LPLWFFTGTADLLIRMSMGALAKRSSQTVRNHRNAVRDGQESAGYGTVTYADGHSALHSFQSNLPDLAILDVKMPHMDGLETLRRLRATSNLPVIFLTSKAEEIDELFGLKMGADDFVRKPFSRALLLERIKAVLRRHSSVRDEPEKI